MHPSNQGVAPQSGMGIEIMTLDQVEQATVEGSRNPTSSNENNEGVKVGGLSGLFGTFEYNDPSDPRRFPEWRKWQIILFTLPLELWANVISSVYSFGAVQVRDEFNVGSTVSKVPQAIYLFGFALGPVILAPLSEDFGRYPVIGGSVLILGLTQIACALTPHVSILIIFRFIGGFFAAGTFTSVGTVADMWGPEEQGWPVNIFALFAEIGAVMGPIFGGYLADEHGWRWLFGVAGIGCAALLVPYLLFVPETRAGVLLSRRAKELRRRTGDERYYAMHQKLRSQHTFSSMIRELIVRPLYMLLTEPIVFWFALFDGVNYAIIYIFLEAYPLIFDQYGFSTGEQGLAFIGILLGFLVGCLCYFFQISFYRRAARKRWSGEASPEDRLLWGLPGGILFPVSLFWFAWTSQPPVHWIVPMLAGGFFGVSSHIMFLIVSDYTVASYSIFAASAIAAQSLVRELLSGAFTLVTEQMYHGLGYRWASSLLGFIGLPLAAIPFVLFWFGPTIRSRSRVAVAEAKVETWLSKAVER
ncbi:MFS general substrate transporter [Violaceomyces palustris]|uniref:MFS general substrate transporter n=1 Tax=Violaceomyces palustris TaxID=1673888 RepID=A0ACD0P0P4_9BASI|nr:MFS general substrate transporter [Violaceomyces palustris]